MPGLSWHGQGCCCFYLGERTAARSKHYISHLLFDGTAVHKQADLAEKNTSLSKESLRQWRPVPKERDDASAE